MRKFPTFRPAIFLSQCVGVGGVILIIFVVLKMMMKLTYVTIVKSKLYVENVLLERKERYREQGKGKDSQICLCEEEEEGGQALSALLFLLNSVWRYH